MDLSVGAYMCTGMYMYKFIVSTHCTYVYTCAYVHKYIHMYVCAYVCIRICTYVPPYIYIDYSEPLYT